MLDMMFSPSCSPRLLRARVYVTSILAPGSEHLRSDIFESILQNCLNIHTLVVDNIPEPVLSITPPSSLKTLGVTTDTLACNIGPPGKTKQHPLFRGITHLVIEMRFYGSEKLQTSNLTHVYTRCSVYERPPWLVPLPAQLQLFLIRLTPIDPVSDKELYKYISQSSWADFQHEGKVDKRFVLIVRHSNTRWRGGSTCGGFVVVPKSWENEYIYKESGRIMLYQWLEKEAWAAGEKVVEQRIDW
ncbi:hypothetical protein DL96DRAFT_1626040 [Flagelloscypha sp. PMI_526]|nr:hypothetical protein DL96DRAFT_1626040 [Flagelloscypha sp. PMI_526]